MKVATKKTINQNLKRLLDLLKLSCSKICHLHFVQIVQSFCILRHMLNIKVNLRRREGVADLGQTISHSISFPKSVNTSEGIQLGSNLVLSNQSLIYMPRWINLLVDLSIDHKRINFEHNLFISHLHTPCNPK